MTKEVGLREVAIGDSFTLCGKRFKKVSPYMASYEGSKEFVVLLDEPTVIVEMDATSPLTLPSPSRGEEAARPAVTPYQRRHSCDS